jgi:3-hydroxymyristoyl/3-hydroxydecanoyl-(acyl carrier protein) dehydratase
MSEERLVTIRNDHPSLSGHFPGNPVIPGVVILEEVLEAIRQTEPVKISFLGAPSVKFHTPLRPEEEMTIRLEPFQSQGRRFICMTGTRLIASGLFTYQRVERSARSQE